MRYYQCLILALIFGIFQDVSGVAIFTKSANEKLRNPGTYIVHVEDNTTDAQLQHFAKQLIRRSNTWTKFRAEIIAEYCSIKCLTAKLSERALKWVRMINYVCQPVILVNAIMCLLSTQVTFVNTTV